MNVLAEKVGEEVCIPVLLDCWDCNVSCLVGNTLYLSKSVSSEFVYIKSNSRDVLFKMTIKRNMQKETKPI